MRTVDCKIVSREIDELDPGQQPSREVCEHTAVCTPCQNFYTDRLKLRQMVAGLGAVEAPPDFDFRLRARLASEGSRHLFRFSSGMFGFGLPSVALATIALLVGAGLVMRALMGPANQSPVAQSESPRFAESATIPTTIGSQEVKDANEKVADAGRESSNPATKQSPRATKQFTVATASNRSRVATKDFSSNQAEVVKRDDLLAGNESASMFPLEASEPLRVSVDYATGVSRTISLPTLSFGSQQVVSRDPAMTKTSARTVW